MLSSYERAECACVILKQVRFLPFEASMSGMANSQWNDKWKESKEEPLVVDYCK